MTCVHVGHYEMKPQYMREVYREKKCIRTNNMLENRLMYYTKLFSLMG